MHIETHVQRRLALATLTLKITTMQLLHFLFFFSVAGQVVVLDRGIQTWQYHTTETPYYVLFKQGQLTICLVSTPDINDDGAFSSSRRCDYITNDCRCYSFVSETSDSTCVTKDYYSNTTTIETTWVLTRRNDVTAVPPVIIITITIITFFKK